MSRKKSESVQSSHPCKSVMQTSVDIVKAHGGVPPVPSRYRELSGAIRLKVNIKVDEGNPDDFGKNEETTFTIQLPL